MTLSERIDRLVLQVEERDSRIAELMVRLDRTCGCVTCICEDEEKCQGCGAKNCELHESYYRQRDTATRELAEAKAEIARLREILEPANYFSSVGVSRGPANVEWLRFRSQLAELLSQKGGDAQCEPSEILLTKVPTSNAAHDTSVERQECEHQWSWNTKAEHDECLLCGAVKQSLEALAVTAERDQLKADNEKLRALVAGKDEALKLYIEAYDPTDGFEHSHFATGPITGDGFKDYIQCPGCVALAAARAALSPEIANEFVRREVLEELVDAAAQVHLEHIRVNPHTGPCKACRLNDALSRAETELKGKQP